MDFATDHGEVGALEGLMQRWARKDPTTAGEWLTRQKAGERKDAAIIGYAEAVSQIDPEAAHEWVTTLPDSRKKKRLLRRLAANQRSIER